MKLEALVDQGMEGTRYLDRYVNNLRAGNHSRWSDTRIEFSPHAGLDEIAAPCGWLDSDSVDVHFAEPSDDYRKLVIQGGRALFVAHPEMVDAPGWLASVDLDGKLTDHLAVTPTSSTRTLHTKRLRVDAYVKTDLDRMHYGFPRSLKAPGVAHSIAISRELERVALEAVDIPFAFLPETIGVVVKSLNDGGTGVVYRECIPRPKLHSDTCLVPFFSLYASDLRVPDDPPLLAQLISKHALAGNELSFFVDEFIRPHLVVWSAVLRRYGLLLEMHGQNTLAEFDRQWRLLRIVYKDFQGLYIDEELRAVAGRPFISGRHVVGVERGVTRAQHYSHLYDHLIGTLLFSRLSLSFVRAFRHYSLTRVCAAIANVASEIMGDLGELLSEDAYSFEKRVVDGEVSWAEASRGVPLFRRRVE